MIEKNKGEDDRVYLTYDDFPTSGIVSLPDLDVLNFGKGEKKIVKDKNAKLYYDDDGKGHFYTRFSNGEVAEKKTKLSFFGVASYLNEKRIQFGEVELVREMGLAKELIKLEIVETARRLNEEFGG